MKIDIKINRIEFKVQKSTHTSTCAGMYMFSHVQLFATPWTVACQAPLTMGFSRQEEHWSGLPFSSSGILGLEWGKYKLILEHCLVQETW